MHTDQRDMSSINGPSTLTVAHTSDLHLGGRTNGREPLWALRSVLDAADEAGAQALILAGDIFDNNRVAPRLIEDVASLLSASGITSVILPGNHDPASDESVYRRMELASAPQVQILGVTTDGSLQLAELGLGIDGIAHVDYADMSPLARVRARSMRWHMVVAHGHWVRDHRDAHRAWLIHDEDLAACGADYVALGHWDLAQPAGDGSVRAYYSGSPEIAKSVNVVRFGDEIDVARHPLRIAGG